jgi:hypothetical protein
MLIHQALGYFSPERAVWFFGITNINHFFFCGIKSFDKIVDFCIFPDHFQNIIWANKLLYRSKSPPFYPAQFRIDFLSRFFATDFLLLIFYYRFFATDFLLL